MLVEMISENRLIVLNAVVTSISGAVLYALTLTDFTQWNATAVALAALAIVCYAVGYSVFGHEPVTLAGGGGGLLIAAVITGIFTPITGDDALMIIGMGIWILIMLPVYESGMGTGSSRGI
ncbi:hypothetical protein [Halostella pelagica]|uniref:hypothetical protein n=1 Tax=Halostella pelagica TaxID=2583824 RepID=UPI0010800FD9|nr:hypothetical protein [Halostella pelagica]